MPNPANYGWLNRKQCAESLAVGPRQFDNDYASLCPPEFTKLDGTRRLYYLREIINAWLAVEAKKLSSKTPAASDDPLMQGASSDALEDYRRARAAQEVFKLASLRREYVRLSEIETHMQGFASAIRKAGETIERQYGQAIAQVLFDAIDAARASWNRVNDGNERTPVDEQDRGRSDVPTPENPPRVRRARNNSAGRPAHGDEVSGPPPAAGGSVV